MSLYFTPEPLFPKVTNAWDVYDSKNTQGYSFKKQRKAHDVSVTIPGHISRLALNRIHDSERRFDCSVGLHFV
jgi:hypothetical protein